jgi:hypothetical protein
MTVEKIVCEAHGQPFVRLLVDDAVQPLDFCGGIDGMCLLEKFVESQKYARENGEGDFEKCFS